ncbi:MAG: PIN domain-containing protein [Gammaproteobacteria bacterium]|nr:PIN domain-containing protein [Gammaproteobacteria bacterium]
MILIDTSSWIHLLRPDGDRAVRRRVRMALESGTACWCPLVQLELWNGARGDRERKVLRQFAEALPLLPMDEAVWSAAYDLARRARSQGVTVPAADLAIATCAQRHGVRIESADADFARLSEVIPVKLS